MSEDNNSQKHHPVFSEERPEGYRFYEQQCSNDFSNMTSQLSVVGNGQQFVRPSQITANEEKQLDQPALGFKIYAAIQAFFSCIPFLHLFMGIMMLTGGFNDGRNIGPPPAFGWMFIIMAVIFITLGWTIAICNYYAGKFIKERRNYLFCFIISCVDCAFMPFGTVLGIFAIILLIRDQIKRAFDSNLKEI